MCTYPREIAYDKFVERYVWFSGRYGEELCQKAIIRCMERCVSEPAQFWWRTRSDGALPPAGNESGLYMIFIGCITAMMTEEEVRECLTQAL